MNTLKFVYEELALFVVSWSKGGMRLKCCGVVVFLMDLLCSSLIFCVRNKAGKLAGSNEVSRAENTTPEERTPFWWASQKARSPTFHRQRSIAAEQRTIAINRTDGVRTHWTP